MLKLREWTSERLQTGRQPRRYLPYPYPQPYDHTYPYPYRYHYPYRYRHPYRYRYRYPYPYPSQAAAARAEDLRRLPQVTCAAPERHGRGFRLAGRLCLPEADAHSQPQADDQQGEATAPVQHWVAPCPNPSPNPNPSPSPSPSLTRLSSRDQPYSLLPYSLLTPLLLTYSLPPYSLSQDADRNDINKFLNRLLGLPFAQQNALFDYYTQARTLLPAPSCPSPKP